MKKIYFNLVLLTSCLLILSSCSTAYKFTTKGLPATDSSFLVTASGKHVDATDIIVKPGKVTVDGKVYPLDSLSSIRSKKMYFAVNDGKIYLGDEYGKIILLYKLVTTTTYSPSYGAGGYGGSGMSSMPTGTTTSRIYYMQKIGSTEVDKLNTGTLIDYVSDNEHALSIAQESKHWKTGSYIAGGAFIGSGIYAIVKLFQSAKIDANGNAASFNFVPPAIAIATTGTAYSVFSGISMSKMFKAIRVYNGTPNDPPQ